MITWRAMSARLIFQAEPRELSRTTSDFIVSMSPLKGEQGSPPDALTGAGDLGRYTDLEC